MIREIRVSLDDKELDALQACVEGTEPDSPDSILIYAERAIAKLRDPQSAARAEAFWQHAVVDSSIPLEASDDFIKGRMFQWFIFDNDYDTREDTMSIVERMFPFFQNLYDDYKAEFHKPKMSTEELLEELRPVLEAERPPLTNGLETTKDIKPWRGQ